MIRRVEDAPRKASARTPTILTARTLSSLNSGVHIVGGEFSIGCDASKKRAWQSNLLMDELSDCLIHSVWCLEPSLILPSFLISGACAFFCL